ncbi:lysylphosphatidylglycerol synthase transmembrane domain-containing protein [Deltaproteobacteria bacterium TL4]
MMKRIVISAAKLGIVVGILFYLVDSGRLNFSRLKLFLDTPSVMFSIVAALLMVVIPLAALRWWLLLRAVGLHVPFSRAFLLTWIGNFFNTTLPGAISGDVVKGYYIIKAQASEGKTKAFTTLLIDRFVGLFGLIVMAFCALLSNWVFILSLPVLHSLVVMIGFLFLGTVLFYMIVLFPFEEDRDPFIWLFKQLPASKLITKIYSAFKSYQHQKWTLLYTLLISIFIHSTIAFLFFQIAALIGVASMNLTTQLFIMPIGLITIAIPIAPGGVGVGHAAFDSLYHMVGINGGADIFNMFVIIQLAVFLLGGIPYFLYSHEYKVQEEPDPET